MIHTVFKQSAAMLLWRGRAATGRLADHSGALCRLGHSLGSHLRSIQQSLVGTDYAGNLQLFVIWLASFVSGVTKPSFTRRFPSSASFSATTRRKCASLSFGFMSVHQPPLRDSTFVSDSASSQMAPISAHHFSQNPFNPPLVDSDYIVTPYCVVECIATITYL